MAFCVQCGAQVEGKFCQKCGAVNPAVPGADAGAQPGAGIGAAPPPTSTASAGGLTDNVAGALCYLIGFVTGIVFLVLAPYNQNPRIRFHAFQAIFFNLAWIAFWMAISIFTAMTKVFALLLLPVYPLVGLCGFGLWLFLMWKAYNNDPLVLPVIGPLAQQQANTR